MGVNVTDGAYGNPNLIETELSGAFGIISRPSGNTVPAASRDANKAPTALYPGDTQVGYVFRSPEDNAVTINFTPAVASAAQAYIGCALVSSNVITGVATFTVDNVLPTAGGFAVNFTPGTGIPKIISAHSSTGAAVSYSPIWDNRIAALTCPGGPIRTMKRSGVEANQGVIITSTAGAFPSPVITAANRNTLSSADWFPSDGGSGGPVNDGPPIEASIAMCVHADRPWWGTIGWNVSDDYIDVWGDLTAQAAIDHGLVHYCELANEVWLGSYLVSTQAYYEAISAAIPPFTGTVTPTVITASLNGTVLTVSAVTSGPSLTVGSTISGDGIDGNTTITSLGTGAGGTGTYNVNISATITSRRMVANCGGRLERYCQRVCYVMDRVKTRWVTKGADLTKLKRCFMWAIDDGTISGAFMDYAPPGFTAVKNHVDVIGGAPYVSNTIQGTSVDALYANIYANIDWTIDIQVKGWQATATARGLVTAFYEAGQGTFINDDATRIAFHADSRMRQFYMHMWARLAAAAPGAAVGNFAYPHTDFSNQSFGILKASVDVENATTHKFTGTKNFVAGQRELLALVGSLSCTQNDPAGTILGTLKFRTPGSIISFPVNPGGGVAVVDGAAQILQIKIATSAAFSAAGTVNITVRETDPRDPAGFRDTDVAITVGAGVTGTQWDNPTSNDAFTISGGGLVVSSAASSDALARASVGHNGTGDWWFDITPHGTSNNAQIGLANATESQSTFLGASANSMGWDWSSGTLLGGSGSPGTFTSTGSDVLRVRVKNGKLYLAKNNTYVLGDPVAQTGGFDVSAKGALFPAVSTSGIWSFTADFTNWQ